MNTSQSLLASCQQTSRRCVLRLTPRGLHCSETRRQFRPTHGLPPNERSVMNEAIDVSHAEPAPDAAAWKQLVLEYQKPSLGRALWQIINTLGPLALVWYLMYRTLAISWWLTLPLAMLAGAFLVRVFII